jgi:putative phosphoribosyl transferase
MRTSAGPPYQDRSEAGRILARSLRKEQSGNTVIFAIPRGGVPVSVEVAGALDLPLDIIVPRKIPIPEDPEAGYGAVTEDGVIVLNETLVNRLGLTSRLIERQAEAVMAEIRRRLELYRRWIVSRSVKGKVAIIIDDGLASGYTMLAAVKSIRRRDAVRVIAASPVASSHAADALRSEADDVVTPIVSSVYPFAVASFYRYWHDLTDEEVIEELERYGKAGAGHGAAQSGSLLGKVG